MAERDRVTYLFRQVILDVGLVTLAAAIDRMAWNELVTEDIAEQIGFPEEACFVKCIDSTVSTIRLRKPSERVFIFFDEALRNRVEAFGRLYMSQREKYPQIEGIGFAPVQKVEALQGADIIATETYQYAQAWLKNPQEPATNPHFRDFVLRDLSGGFIFCREHIEEMVVNFRKNSGFKANPSFA